MEAWEVAAREAIRELVARYAQLADRGRLDDLVALFLPDGVLRIDDRPPLAGRDAIRAFLGGTATDLTATTRVLRHHTSTHAIDVAGPTEATGACYFLVVTDRGPDHWGRYRDVYRVHDGAWRFAERRVRVDGSAPGSWAAERRGRALSAPSRPASASRRTRAAPPGSPRPAR